MAAHPDVSVKPGSTTRRSLFGAAAGVVGLATLGATGCAQRQNKVPVELRWYSWGPTYPVQWTVGPGLNQRNIGFGGGQTAPGQPTPVPPEAILAQQISAFTAEREDLTVTVSTERFDRYHQKLVALAIAGQLPDVIAYDNHQALPLIKGNALYNLSRLQGSKIRQFLQNFPASYLEG